MSIRAQEIKDVRQQDASKTLSSLTRTPKTKVVRGEVCKIFRYTDKIGKTGYIAITGMQGYPSPSFLSLFK